MLDLERYTGIKIIRENNGSVSRAVYYADVCVEACVKVGNSQKSEFVGNGQGEMSADTSEDYDIKGADLIQQPEMITIETQQRDRVEAAKALKAKEGVMHVGFMMDGTGDLGPGLMEPDIEVEIYK